LKLDVLVVNNTKLGAELDTDSKVVDRLETLICKLEKQARLSNTWQKQRMEGSDLRKDGSHNGEELLVALQLTTHQCHQ
jgi:hypothetical protein